MSHIRLIISDIDGTILNDHHQIDPQLASLIPDLKREKIPFVLASARSPKGMAPIAKELGIEDCPMACYNGALIQKGEQVLFEHPLDKIEARQFIDWANQHFPQVSINLYSGKDWMTIISTNGAKRRPGLQEKNLSFFPYCILYWMRQSPSTNCS